MRFDTILHPPNQIWVVATRFYHLYWTLGTQESQCCENIVTTGRVTGPKSGPVSQKYDDFSSFKSFFTPGTQFERPKPCFPNSPEAKAPSKVGILKIYPVRGELGVRDATWEVSKLAVYALRHHFASPKPDLGGRNQILSPLLDVRVVWNEKKFKNSKSATNRGIYLMK